MKICHANNGDRVSDHLSVTVIGFTLYVPKVRQCGLVQVSYCLPVLAAFFAAFLAIDAAILSCRFFIFASYFLDAFDIGLISCWLGLGRRC